MKTNMQWVERTLAGMTTEEKVGQTLMVSFFFIDQKVLPDIIKGIKEYHLGGIFHSGCSYNEMADCLAEMQRNTKVPLLISADYEIGPGWMVKEGIKFPRSMARGHKGTEASEYEIGKITAVQGRSMGATMTFSPVLDVNTNNLCPDINIRAYGDDVETVSRLSIPYIKGVQDNGMLATAKHFPGNGVTDMDQHICAAIIGLSREEMDRVCLEPYRRAFKATDVGAIMVAHLEVPSLTTEINPRTGRLVPASLSKEVITDLLRKEMGYQGLVITDALNMGGVTVQYGREEVAVKAIQAGCDVLLVFDPDDFYVEYNAVLKAVKSGAISIERLDDAVRHILTAKTKVGIDKDGGMPAAKEVRDEAFRPGKYTHVCTEIAEQAVTVLKNGRGFLPVGDIRGKKVLVLNTFNPDHDTCVKQGQPPMTEIITQRLQERGAIVTTHDIAPEMALRDLQAITKSAKNFDYIFLNFFVVPNWGIGTMIPNKNALRLFMFGLLSVEKPLIITSFGDPYVMYYCPTAQTYVCTFDDTTYSQEAAIKAWFGESPVSGKMPVSLKNIFSKGDGVEMPAKRS